MTPTKDNNNKIYIPFIYKYKQSKRCEKERLCSKNRRKYHNTIHKTDEFADYSPQILTVNQLNVIIQKIFNIK